VCDIVVKSSRSLSRLLMSSCIFCKQHHQLTKVETGTVLLKDGELA